MKHLFKSLIVTVLFLSNSSLAASTLGAVIVQEKGADFGESCKRICANPHNILIDFSQLHLTDDDLTAIFQGLVERQKVVASDPSSPKLMLLSLVSDAITQRGILNFLQKLQRGQESSDGTSVVIPDLSDAILKVYLTLDEEFLEEASAIAPAVFAKHLKLISS